MKCTNCNKENRDDFIFCRCCAVKNKPSDLDLLDKSLHTTDWKFYFKRAQELTNSKKYQYREALEYFEKALELNPTEPDIYNARGRCYTHILCCKRKDHMVIEALSDFNTALKLNPGNLHALNNIGHCQQRVQKFFEAIDTFNGVLKKEPINIDALSGIAHSKMCVGDYKGAKKDALKVLKIIPDHSDSLFTYSGILMRQYDFKKGFAILKKLAEKDYSISRMIVKSTKQTQFLVVLEIKNKGFILKFTDDKGKANKYQKQVFKTLDSQPIEEYYSIVRRSGFITSYQLSDESVSIIDTFKVLKNSMCTVSVLKIDVNTFSLKAFIKKRVNKPVVVVKKSHSRVFEKYDIEEETQIAVLTAI